MIGFRHYKFSEKEKENKLSTSLFTVFIKQMVLYKYIPSFICFIITVLVKCGLSESGGKILGRGAKLVFMMAKIFSRVVFCGALQRRVCLHILHVY